MAAPSGSPEGGTLLRIGEILGAHGVKGEVRLRSLAAKPAQIAGYSPLLSEDGRRSFALTALRASAAPNVFIARLTGVLSRDGAEGLAGTGLYVARELVAADLDKGEFLHADLIGCRVERGGETIGKVVAVQNFGAGDILEVALRGTSRTEFLPFAAAFVPKVDLTARRIVVAEGILPPPD
ncbi:MAG: 16S rRNA processing protein RimM [Hyphomicrobiales bacterium]|nr:16S rRNA processing protein RimM [Hyphomicrobiales bacterium]